MYFPTNKISSALSFQILNYIFCVLPAGVGIAQVWDGEPPEKGSTAGPNLSGVSWILRNIWQLVIQKLYLHELSFLPQSSSHPGYIYFKGGPVMGEIIKKN